MLPLGGVHGNTRLGADPSRSRRVRNGADLGIGIGIGQEWLPLFDQYGVDLVACGHEHHYERFTRFGAGNQSRR